MPLIGGRIGVNLLRLGNYLVLRRYKTGLMDGSAYTGKSKMEVLLGKDVWQDIEGKTVLDFGCGSGSESIEMAQHGAKVTGLDILERSLEQARQNAKDAGLDITFTTKAEGEFDVVLSFDAFEHYGDPVDVLNQMAQLLKPDGRVIVSFGCPWYHPVGGHTFSPFPWAHLLFTEKALIKWREYHIQDGATRFGEVEGGLNQMTIKRFEQIVSKSAFCFSRLEIVPIRPLRRFHNRFTREFTTSTLRAFLSLRNSQVGD